MSSTDGDQLRWLMQWYRSQCDGDWEHQQGVRIGTLDNPGWSLDVDLAGTSEQGRSMPEELVERSEQHWLFVEAKDNVFRSRGGPENLVEMIDAFKSFVSGVGSS